MREKFGVKVLKSEGRGGRKRGRRVSCIFSDFYLCFVLVGEGGGRMFYRDATGGRVG